MVGSIVISGDEICFMGLVILIGGVIVDVLFDLMGWGSMVGVDVVLVYFFDGVSDSLEWICFNVGM